MPMEQVAIYEVLRRRAWLIVALCVVAALAGYAGSFLLTERYTASALVLVRPQQPIQIDGRNLDKSLYDFPATASMPVETPAKTYIQIIKSEALIGGVASSLGLSGAVDNRHSFWSKFIPTYLTDGAEQDFKNAVEILKYGRLIKDDPFADAVKEISDNLTLDSIEDSYVFRITFAGRTPQMAAEVANRLANSFTALMEKNRLSEVEAIRDDLKSKLDESRQQLLIARERLESSKEAHSTLHSLKLQELDVEAAQSAYQTVSTEYKEADINVSYPQPEVRLVSRAVPPHAPSSPSRVKVALVSLFGGLLAGIGLALLLEYINPRIRGIADVEDIVGLKVLATIPRISRRRWRRAGL
jgi:uncharacterized protein involved in exopolysaccharide biosynthesis